MILFGLYEAQNSLQIINALRRLDIIENISSTNIMREFVLSDFERTWNIRFVYIGLLVWFIFIVGGIFLLIKKSYSVKFAYVAITLSILFFIIQCIVFVPNSAVLFGLLVGFVLLIVLSVSDKTAFDLKEGFEE